MAGVGSSDAFADDGAFLIAGTPPQGGDYVGLSGPATFGPSTKPFDASSSTGDFVFLFGSNGELGLPDGYTSGTVLMDSDVFGGATLASLGAGSRGTYTYTYGSGADTGSLIVNIGVPEPGTWAGLAVGAAGLGAVTLRRRVVRAA